MNKSTLIENNNYSFQRKIDIALGQMDMVLVKYGRMR